MVIKRSRALLIGALSTLPLWALPASAADTATASSAVDTQTLPAANWQVRTDRALAQALYELAYSPSMDALFVASAGGFEDDAKGVVYQLDPDSLEVQKRWALPGQAFGLAFDEATKTLYLGDTLDQSLIRLNVDTGATETLQLAKPAPEPAEGEEKPFGPNPRQLVLSPDGQTLYISGVGTESVLWVVDTKRFALEKTVTGFGEWATGLALDADTDRLFVSTYKDNAVRVVDTTDNTLVDQWPTGGKSPLNLALDKANHHLFVTHAKSNAVTVLDTRTGKQVTSIDLGGDSLAAAFDAPEHRLLVSQRDAKKLSIIDTDELSLEGQLPLETAMPNSLALSPDGKRVWLTLKQPIKKVGEVYKAEKPDHVATLSPAKN
ncbi:YncE family protein [Larsenimonas salina]|uniref:YncE family protein n=1 Tax=Larsenimonas salina TaxID=1295565 RepID=UPI0020741E0C|nr:beta-propeller fold lactonase family protein [Larsenimonas salina]MCM5704070.1 beta-propeller fold lactonase family protein [Larsenimonas salina]